MALSSGAVAIDIFATNPNRAVLNKFGALF